jgi:hypothetical protein
LATAAYIDDVLAIAAGLDESGLGPAILEAAPVGRNGDEAEIELRVDSNDLRPAIVLQQALQLSVDAATLYLVASEEKRRLDPDYVAAFLAERPVELVVVQLSTGSFLARFSINPLTKAGRGRTIAIAGLAATGLVLTGVLAPVALTVVGGVAFINVIATPDAKAPNQQVPLKTIDPAEAREAPIAVEVSGTESQKPFIYKIDVEGPSEAVKAFLSQLRQLDSVLQARIRPEVQPGPHKHLLVWSSHPLDTELVNATGRELGLEVVDIRTAQ